MMSQLCIWDLDAVSRDTAFVSHMVSFQILFPLKELCTYVACLHNCGLNVCIVQFLVLEGKVGNETKQKLHSFLVGS